MAGIGRRIFIKNTQRTGFYLKKGIAYFLFNIKMTELYFLEKTAVFHRKISPLLLWIGLLRMRRSPKSVKQVVLFWKMGDISDGDTVPGFLNQSFRSFRTKSAA